MFEKNRERKRHKGRKEGLHRPGLSSPSKLVHRELEGKCSGLGVCPAVGAPAGFPGGSVLKNLLASDGDVRDSGSIPGSGRSPGVGNANPLQHSCLKNQPHGQRSMAGYSQQHCKESDMTEHTPAHKLS